MSYRNGFSISSGKKRQHMDMLKQKWELNLNQKWGKRVRVLEHYLNKYLHQRVCWICSECSDNIGCSQDLNHCRNNWEINVQMKMTSVCEGCGLWISLQAAEAFVAVWKSYILMYDGIPILKSSAITYKREKNAQSKNFVL